MIANPLYFIALAGLAVPIAIHLLSRKEGKIIKIGSVRHVLETSTQQFKGIRINEILLLILRCSMIIIFVLLLSGLQFFPTKKEKWVLVEKGLERWQPINSFLDSLKGEGYEMHWLAKGFPYGKDSSKVDDTNYWRLVEELKGKNLSQVVVLSRNQVNRFKGERVSLPENFRWISQSLPDRNYRLKAIQWSNDSALVRVGHTSATETSFTCEKVSSPSKLAASPPDTIKILLVADHDFALDQKIIKVALTAIENSLPVKIKLTEGDPKQFDARPTDWLIWLSSQKPPRKSENIIRFDQEPSQKLIHRMESKKWIFTKRLNEEIALKENLTLQLASLLLPAKNERAIAKDNDQRVLSDSMAWNASKHSTMMESAQPLTADSYLIAALLLLLLVERIIAYKKNQ